MNGGVSRVERILTIGELHPPATATAECGCPITDGGRYIRHQRETCTHPIAHRLNWFAGEASE